LSVKSGTALHPQNNRVRCEHRRYRWCFASENSQHQQREQMKFISELADQTVRLSPFWPLRSQALEVTLPRESGTTIIL
jgi:hypothetical protein